MSTDDSNSNEMEYKKAIDEILSYVPDADPTKIRQEFERYENDFLIPPQDAKRSVMRKFQTEHGLQDNETANTERQMPATKKVSRLTDLGVDDRNVEIEVEIITHNPRIQTVRGEERQISFGLIEDDPWNEGGGNRTRWSYKDWGNHPQ